MKLSRWQATLIRTLLRDEHERFRTNSDLGPASARAMAMVEIDKSREYFDRIIHMMDVDGLQTTEIPEPIIKPLVPTVSEERKNPFPFPPDLNKKKPINRSKS